MGAAGVLYQKDVAFPLVRATKGMLAPAHAVVNEEAHGKDVHALALALMLPTILMPQLLR